jgi:hypothetical protein
MLEKGKYQRNNGNEKVKLSGCAKFFELLVHYNIYKEKCGR